MNGTEAINRDFTSLKRGTRSAKIFNRRRRAVQQKDPEEILGSGLAMTQEFYHVIVRGNHRQKPFSRVTNH
jgi:hypothetical protein